MTDLRSEWSVYCSSSQREPLPGLRLTRSFPNRPLVELALIGVELLPSLLFERHGLDPFFRHALRSTKHVIHAQVQGRNETAVGKDRIGGQAHEHVGESANLLSSSSVSFAATIFETNGGGWQSYL